MDITNKRLITDKEGAFLYGMSINTFRDFSEKAGAVKFYGRKRLNDKGMIDAWLDNLPSGANIKDQEINGKEMHNGNLL